MTVTIGIASLFTGNEREEVLRFWNIFETDYNSNGVQAFDHLKVYNRTKEIYI